jgi:HlyD family secretion protein
MISQSIRWRGGAVILAALAALSACGRGGGAPFAASGESDTEPAVVSPETPYAAISAGKVDIEGGLVDVAARAPGIVREVLVQEGDRVARDQVLARQDDEDAVLSRNRVAAQLRASEAEIPVTEVQLEAARREETRLASLVIERAVSQQAYDQAVDARKRLEAQLAAQKASLSLVRAQLAQANYQVELYVVRAPTDGRIVRRYANPGSGASTLQVTPMFQLQPDTARIIRAEVEERSLSLVSVGQRVEIVPEADQTKTFPGQVIRIAEVMGSRRLRSDDPSERTDERVVEVVVDANEAPVLVGQRVFVKFIKPSAR